MDERTIIVLSIPDDFKDKFLGFVNNVNMLNNDSGEPPIIIEDAFKKKKIAATPKRGV